MNAGWGYGTGSATVTFFQPPPCACRAPGNVVMQRAKLVGLLEEVRKLTHPDVNPSPKATAVTAQLNACLDEIKPKPP